MARRDMVSVPFRWEAIGPMAQMAHLLSRTPLIGLEEPSYAPDHIAWRLEFRDVSFAYPSRGVTVLQGLSFKAVGP